MTLNVSLNLDFQFVVRTQRTQTKGTARVIVVNISEPTMFP